MKIILTGLSHRTATLELLERVAFSAEQARRALQELRRTETLREVTILSTCNRSEIYGLANSAAPGTASLKRFFASFHGIGEEALDGSFYTREGVEAARHLFRVSAGLDSMLVGEAEILGQVREAFREAREFGVTGPVLQRLFQDALAAGRRVRAETEIGVRPTSIALAAVKLAEKIFARLRDRTVLILGAGSMAEQAAKCLEDRGVARVLVANRSPERGADLAQRIHGQAIAWENLEKSLPECDIVICSTGAAEFVLGPAGVERAMAIRKNRSLVFIDISVPRNIDPQVERLYNVYLYNLEDFQQIVEQNKKEREKEVPRAERLIAEQVGKFFRWLESRALSATLFALQRKLAGMSEAEIERHLGERILTLAAAERDQKAALARSLVREIRRQKVIPVEHLRPVVVQLGHVDGLRTLFALDEEES